MTSLSSDVVLYRTRLTQIEHVNDELPPDDLPVEAVLSAQSDPLVRLGDRDLNWIEALALAQALQAAAATIEPRTTVGQTAFGRALTPDEMSTPTPWQRRLARHRAGLDALLVGMVAEAKQVTPDPADWLSWHRLVTEDGTMHLSWLSMSPGQVLCHYENQHPAAEVLELAAPGKPVTRAERVCADCIAAARQGDLA